MIYGDESSSDNMIRNEVDLCGWVSYIRPKVSGKPSQYIIAYSPQSVNCVHDVPLGRSFSVYMMYL